MLDDSGRIPLSSRVLARILDHRKRLDYLWLGLFAALPIALAGLIGVHRTTSDGFLGYWERLNWTILVLILPAAVFGMRWMAMRIGPVLTRDPPSSLPPVVGLIDTAAGREMAYAAFRGVILSPRNFLAAMLITLLIHVVDMAQLGGVYLSEASQVCPSPGVCAEQLENEHAGQNEEAVTIQWLQVPFAGTELRVEKDWSVAYLGADDGVNKWANLGLNLSAYSVQFAVIFIGILAGILILRHNLFFLSRIYQRRRVPSGEEFSYIRINLDDREKCFGFRSANDAFNVQVLALTIAAVFIVFTRSANVGPGTELFPDPGQWLAVLTWVVALAIVSLPILIKLLPRIPYPGAGRAPASLIDYLREFLSDEAWAVGRDTPPEEIDAVAARFAENAFWPTGNNRAWQLYFLSFWVFFIALVPDLRAVLDVTAWWWKPIGWAVACALAWVATWGLFQILRFMLSYIDKRLVEAPARPADQGVSRRRKIPIGVFISYRRKDTAAYTGRLYDSLSRYIDKDSLFMDLDKIRGGIDFMQEVKKAIDTAQAMIVVIGPEWLTVAGDDGLPRLKDPGDFVHQELALGLQRDIRVFPVLVGEATMPSKDSLPDGLQKLAELHAREISNSRWDHDVGQLIIDLETTVPRGLRAGGP